MSDGPFAIEAAHAARVARQKERRERIATAVFSDRMKYWSTGDDERAIQREAAIALKCADVLIAELDR